MKTMRWIDYPDDLLVCSGLPWHDENLPDLWRFPKRLASSLPDGVRQQMCFPSGARLRLRSDTPDLSLRIRSLPERPPSGLDVYVDGRFWGTTPAPKKEEDEVVCFADAGREMKEIAVYLPLRSELQIVAYGVDSDAGCEPPGSYARANPVVLYGSSVAQGIGAARPGMSYAAILCRAMNMDLVNLGFGGAGKAEEEVVALVSQVKACCYLFDLGKSYGLQSADAYTAMLHTLRLAHPDVPFVCVTPIFSAREFYSESYRDLSQHTRTVVRDAVSERLDSGDGRVFLVDGEALLSAHDSDGLAGDRIHPNDLGHSLIAERLRPTLESALQQD